MIFLLLMLGAARAVEPPELPPAPATVPGEGSQTFPLSTGSPVPLEIAGGAGLAGCSAVCEPLSSYAHLLQLEQYARTCRDLYKVDVNALTADRDYWQNVAQTNTKPPLIRQPWVVAVTTSILFASAFVAYDQINTNSGGG